MVEFTQYMLPDGEKKPIQIHVPMDLQVKATEINKRGYKFEAEVLRTGEVSFTVADPKLGDDIEIEICPNGPGVMEAVHRLIARAYDLVTSLNVRAGDERVLSEVRT